LCEEPMVGVCFIVEGWDMEPVDSLESANQPFGPYSGQIMSAVKEGCRKAFQCQPQRLMVAMYSCNIQVNSEVLGKYQVLFYIYIYCCMQHYTIPQTRSFHSFSPHKLHQINSKVCCRLLSSFTLLKSLHY